MILEWDCPKTSASADTDRFGPKIVLNTLSYT